MLLCVCVCICKWGGVEELGEFRHDWWEGKGGKGELSGAGAGWEKENRPGGLQKPNGVIKKGKACDWICVS